MIRLISFIFLIPLLINAQNPNYSEHVAPILHNKCLQCHNVDGIAPISLETYADAVSNAGLIQHVTSTGEMPPWPPDTLFQNYAYENTLNENELSTNIFTNTNLPSGNLLSIFNILGQKQEIEYNKPLLYLYDNVKINKKIVID